MANQGGPVETPLTAPAVRVGFWTAIVATMVTCLASWPAGSTADSSKPPFLDSSLNYGPRSLTIDMNQATVREWAVLPGIGDVLARRIVADRERQGRFETVDQITRVTGFGPKKLAQTRRYLTCDPAPVAAIARRPRR